MNLEEVKSKISVINAEVSRLNTKRNQNLGKVETLNSQLKDALEKYKATYGVDLSAGGLEEELAKVVNEKETELNKLSSIITAINNGDYNLANQLAGVSPSVEVQTSTPSEPVVEPAPTSVESVPTPNVVPPTPVVEPSSQVVSEPTPVAPTPSVTPPTPVAPPPSVEPPVTPPTLSVAPPPPTLSGAESLGLGMPALEGFTKPETVSPPVTPPKSPVQDFGAILNGTAFSPQ